MIKMTLHELIEAQSSLTEVLQMELPVKISYWVAKIAKKLDKELKNYYEQRIKLIQKYGVAIEKEIEIEKNGKKVKEKQKTNDWKLLPENEVIFNKEHKELLKVEVKIDMEPVKLNDLEKIKRACPHCEKFLEDEIRIKPEILFLLDKIMVWESGKRGDKNGKS